MLSHKTSLWQIRAYVSCGADHTNAFLNRLTTIISTRIPYFFLCIFCIFVSLYLVFFPFVHCNLWINKQSLLVHHKQELYTYYINKILNHWIPFSLQFLATELLFLCVCFCICHDVYQKVFCYHTAKIRSTKQLFFSRLLLFARFWEQLSVL